ncbi:histidinol-phosphatase [Prosthecobacter sp.]|uniref:histidinol-phosphatase n=1 Tax=Prosthecobacter sp. TaxID=1965333 RepID=UPI002AB85C98|nr:histidinol-phosphatase [Prosthecobacter sp.]MDZ4404730.1 histidinol-phosphatase [Prosthecobacter sp.]
MSKSKSTQKKAARGKARPATRGKSKKVASKPIPKKKARPTPARKTVLKKKPAPVKKAAPAKSAAKKKAPAPKPVAKKSVAKVLPKKAQTSPAKVSAVKPAQAPLKPSPKPVTKPQVSAKPVVAAKSATAVKTAPATVATPKQAPAPAAIAPAPAKKGPSQPLPASGPTKSGALFYDSHMHTPLCKHAWGEPEEYAQQALKAGLKGIIFTCHCPMPNGFWPTVRMSESEFDTYVALVQRAADAFKGKLDIRLGIESEYYPGCEEYITQLHQRADFHYVLGAVHWQAKEYLNKYETGTIENFRRTYFDHLAKSAESGLYDCIAHPDLVKNYHPDSWCFAIVKNTVSTVLDRIAATGVAMELNTSGLNKSYSEMNPGLEMLRMMADRKIPIVVGSDSHRAVRVGEHFVTALNHLTEAGYEKVSYFLNRQRIDLKISDVLASLKKAADHNA